MKITISQLRKIIAEESKKVTLKEASGHGSDSAELSLMESAAERQVLLDVIFEGWKYQYNPHDPSMDAAGGKQAWESQCEMACEVLGEKIEELIAQVEEDLHLGKFYSEANMPFSGKYRE